MIKTKQQELLFILTGFLQCQEGDIHPLMQLVLSQPFLNQFQLSITRPNHSHKLMRNAQLNLLCLVSFCVHIIIHMHRYVIFSYSVFSLPVGPAFRDQVIGVCAWACSVFSLHFTTGHGECFPRTGRGSQRLLHTIYISRVFQFQIIAVAPPHTVAVCTTTPPTHAHQLQTSSTQYKVHFNSDLLLKGFQRECIHC